MERQIFLTLTIGLLCTSFQSGPAIHPAGETECDCTVPVQPQGQVAGRGQALPLQENPPRAHDPVLTKEGDTYYVFTTGRGISVQTSKDRVTWQPQAPVFEKPPAWTAETIPGSKDFYWAPDISFFNGKWHLYYSVSTFGKNHSAIGLATNVTLDVKRADFQWKDEGIVVESKQGDDWNAIDPNLVLDAKRQPWLTLGSFWSGIKLFQLNPATGRLATPDAAPLSLASRPHTREIQGAIEAPFLIYRKGYYYLFASFDFCCRGVNSTYNIRVGRSHDITGPYVDREGKPMREGGGTPVQTGSGRWRGPGHNAVYREGNTDWLVYHAYDAEDNGAPKLRIEKMKWDAGWPQSPSLVTAPSEQK